MSSFLKKIQQRGHSATEETPLMPHTVQSRLWAAPLKTAAVSSADPDPALQRVDDEMPTCDASVQESASPKREPQADIAQGPNAEAEEDTDDDEDEEHSVNECDDELLEDEEEMDDAKDADGDVVFDVEEGFLKFHTEFQSQSDDTSRVLQTVETMYDDFFTIGCPWVSLKTPLSASDAKEKIKQYKALSVFAQNE